MLDTEAYEEYDDWMNRYPEMCDRDVKKNLMITGEELGQMKAYRKKCLAEALTYAPINHIRCPGCGALVVSIPCMYCDHEVSHDIKHGLHLLGVTK